MNIKKETEEEGKKCIWSTFSDIREKLKWTIYSIAKRIWVQFDDYKKRSRRRRRKKMYLFRYSGKIKINYLFHWLKQSKFTLKSIFFNWNDSNQFLKLSAIIFYKKCYLSTDNIDALVALLWVGGATNPHLLLQQLTSQVMNHSLWSS